MVILKELWEIGTILVNHSQGIFNVLKVQKHLFLASLDHSWAIVGHEASLAFSTYFLGYNFLA
jgi:hypothetical protein